MRNTTHKNTNDPQKKYRLGTISKTFYWGGGAKTGFIEPFSPLVQMWIKTSPASLRSVLEQEH